MCYICVLILDVLWYGTTAAIAVDDTSASSYNSRGLVYDKIGEVPTLLALLLQKYKKKKGTDAEEAPSWTWRSQTSLRPSNTTPPTPSTATIGTNV